MALLDGKDIADDQIDPTKHKFVGMFRYPSTPSGGVVMCGCGSFLHNLDQVREHWQAGHMDIAQYATINQEVDK